VTEHFVYIRLLLAQHRDEAAEVLLAKLERWARATGRYGRLIDIYLLQADAAYGRAQLAEASSHLTQALQLAAPEGYKRSFLDNSVSIALLPGIREVASAFVDELLATLARTAGRGLRTEAVESSHSALSPQSSALVEPLTDRELDILRLIAEGYSNQAIADTLIIAVSTVKRHINNIYGKLDVQSRTQALMRARELHIL
jgi:LuxR family maltose regulon positive regulatory protein